MDNWNTTITIRPAVPLPPWDVREAWLVPRSAPSMVGHSADNSHLVNARQDFCRPTTDRWQISLTCGASPIRVSGPSFPLVSLPISPRSPKERNLDLVDNSIPLCPASRHLASVPLVQRGTLISPVSPSPPPHDFERDVLAPRNHCRRTKNERYPTGIANLGRSTCK